jgi:hypothetical protein
MSHKKFPIHPARPELLCWGCDKYCAATDMLCGNGSDRTQHPYELFGEGWHDWGSDFKGPDAAPVMAPQPVPVPVLPVPPSRLA